MLPGKKITPVDIGLMAWRRRWLIAIPMFVCFYAALVVSSQLRDTYQSEMLIQIVPQRVPDAYVRSTVTMRTEERLSALTQQVTSRTELERLITQMDLYKAERRSMPMQDVVSAMRKAINTEVVKSQRDSRDPEAFYVKFTYPEREIATAVTERVGALFISLNARDRGQLAEGTNSFLQTQLAEAREKLEVTDSRLKVFRERNAGRLPTQMDVNMQGIHNTQMQLQNVTESLARDRDRKQLQEQLLADSQAERVLLQSAPPPITPTGGDLSVSPGATAQQQLSLEKDRLAALQLRLTPEHPDIGRAQRRIADLEARVAKEAAAAKASGSDVRPAPTVITPAEQARRDSQQRMRAEIDSLDRQIRFKEGEMQRLQRVLDDYQRRVEQTPGVESEFIALTRDYQTQQETYRDLLSKTQQANVAAELEKRQIGEQFRVLDPARLPIRPVGVPRVQLNLAGAGVGLLLGLIIAALLEFFDTTYRRADEVREIVKLPVLALVPRFMTDADHRRARRQRLLASVVTAVVAIAAGYGFWAMQLWRHLT